MSGSSFLVAILLLVALSFFASRPKKDAETLNLLFAHLYDQTSNQLWRVFRKNKWSVLIRANKLFSLVEDLRKVFNIM
jgi:hypothetical protein